MDNREYVSLPLMKATVATRMDEKMFRFIYPMSTQIARRQTARRRFDAMTTRHAVTPIRTNLREETFECDIMFRDIDTGRQMTERQRVYTFTFYLDDAEAKRLLASLCTSTQKRARVLTRTSALLLLDDDLAVSADWGKLTARNGDVASPDQLSENGNI
jgi:hypothetical protein